MIAAEKVRAMHRERAKSDCALFQAPGRVNLIGEHTDYAEGFVLPAAIEFATTAAISPRADNLIRIYSSNFNEERGFDSLALPAKGSGDWSDYPMGVAAMLAGQGHRIPGFTLTVASDVPLGSGLSSSAAIEVATALALQWLMGFELPRPKLARLCQRAENEFVGANCGIMDQFISANAQAGHALLLDCRDLSFRMAHIPENVELVIANTMVRHSVAGGEYRTRRAEVEEACAVIGKHRPEVKFLRDATLEDLAQWAGEMSANAVKRARHVIGENLRTVAAADALEAGDLKRVGQLMAEAHESYSREFEGSCAEADLMVELANGLPGLIGARLTGGGFGGCTVNLVEKSRAEGFSERLGAAYKERTGIVAEIHKTRAAEGAGAVASS